MVLSEPRRSQSHCEILTCLLINHLCEVKFKNHSQINRFTFGSYFRYWSSPKPGEECKNNNYSPVRSHCNHGVEENRSIEWKIFTAIHYSSLKIRDNVRLTIDQDETNACELLRYHIINYMTSYRMVCIHALRWVVFTGNKMNSWKLWYVPTKCGDFARQWLATFRFSTFNVLNRLIPFTIDRLEFDCIGPTRVMTPTPRYILSLNKIAIKLKTKQREKRKKKHVNRIPPPWSCCNINWINTYHLVALLPVSCLLNEYLMLVP